MGRTHNAVTQKQPFIYNEIFKMCNGDIDKSRKKEKILGASITY